MVSRDAVLGIVFALAALASPGCRSSSPDLEKISDAITSADSLRHRPLPDRKRVGLEDLPVASPADSDSVAWLKINQVLVLPEGHQPSM